MLTLIWYLDITDRKCFWEPWGTSNRPIVLATWGTAGTARSIRYFWFTSHGQSQEVARCREHCSWTLLVANQSCSIVLAIILRCHATILLVDLIVWLVQFLYLLDSWPYNVASPIQKLVSDPSIARYIYIYVTVVNFVATNLLILEAPATELWQMDSPCPDFTAVQDAILLVDRFRSSSTRLQTLRCSMILKMIPTRHGIYDYHKWVQLYPHEYERNPPIRADDSHRFDHVSWVFFNNFMSMSDILQFGGLNLPLRLVKHLWAGSIWFLLHDLNICIWTSNSKMSFSHWVVDY